MDKGNQTLVNEFILLGLTSVPHLKILAFMFFLFMYLLNLLANISIILVVIMDSHLHTPMYVLLSNLSFFDIFCSSTMVPKMLEGLVVEENRISFRSCITQLFFFHFLGCTEALLLSSMSYDRYVAICDPLRYNVIMGKNTCIQLISSCWLTGFAYSLAHTLLTSKLPFCNLNKVNHYFCDIKPLLKLACYDTHLNERLVTIVTGFAVLCNFLLILTSYILIGSHILNMQSSHGHYKAFSTCTSHLIVVLLFFGPGSLIYIRPSTKDTLQQDRHISLLYTVITPALNPLIYALRSKEVKVSIQSFFLRPKYLK